MAGQIVMEGFIDWKVNPMWRRFITRALAILPAMAVIVIGGQQASNDLLIMSQVILSFALPFAVYPLVQLTSDEGIMGTHFVNSTWQCVVAYFCAVIITGLNVMLIYLTFAG
jgi:manganese transport protein